jgi:hypothetical protein
MGTPWESLPELWKDEKEFCSKYLRGAARAVWSKHPIRTSYMKATRYKAPIGIINKGNLDGMVWAWNCEICNCVTRKPETDHKKQCGSTGSVAEWKSWMENLLIVGYDDLQLLCKNCHDCKSYSDRMGISFEAALVKKKEISDKKALAAQKKAAKTTK